MPIQPSYPLDHKRVWVAGHLGMVGSALVRRLSHTKAVLLTATRREVDLRDQAAVNQWIRKNRPEAVFIAAGTVGGIEADRSRPVEFLFDNLMIAANIIHAAAEVEVSKLMFIDSSCLYPRETEQPIREENMLTGLLEPTNEWYSVATLPTAILLVLGCAAYPQDPQAVRPVSKNRRAMIPLCLCAMIFRHELITNRVDIIADSNPEVQPDRRMGGGNRFSV